MTGYRFVNAGGGCGDPECDYQLQCDPCFAASERQYAEWFARAGYSRSMFRLVIDEMHAAAHAEALELHYSHMSTTDGAV